MSTQAWKPVRNALLGVALMAPAAGAQQVTVSGRVVESGSQTGILGATLELPGRVPAFTGPDGTFEIANVAPGSYTLRAEALGYLRATLDIVVSSDTALTIELERAPIRLDSMVVEGRNVTVKGEVRDRTRDMGLLEAEVYASDGTSQQTDGIGRFRLEDVPANVPLVIRVEEFGYLPLTTTIAPENDTTLRFELEEDPVVQRIIAQQLSRIADRAADKRYPYEPPIERDELLKSRNGPLMGLIGRFYRGRIGCVAIDERGYSGEFRKHSIENLRIGEIEHIDALWDGSGKSSLMIRIYTREFVRRMIGNDEPLIPLEQLIDGARTNDCR
jgi:hypothetical protein